MGDAPLMLCPPPCLSMVVRGPSAGLARTWSTATLNSAQGSLGIVTATLTGSSGGVLALRAIRDSTQSPIGAVDRRSRLTGSRCFP